MLGLEELIPYLLCRRLINLGSVIEGKVVITDSSRRNINYIVLNDETPCFIIKQGVGPEGAATIAHEANVYKLLSFEPEDEVFNNYIPRFYEYDPAKKVLILEYLRNAQSLQIYHINCKGFPKYIGAATGSALASLHKITLTEGTDHINLNSFNAREPWTLSIHRPELGALTEISGVNLQLVKIVQQSSEFCGLLDKLRDEWKMENLIHRDIKWDNCVITKAENGKKPEIKIVDWELACIGDPCWDIGSVFMDYLSFWLLSIPITGEKPLDEFVKLAKYPLSSMQPAINAFWNAYIQKLKIDSQTANELLLRSTKYSAARLIQTAYEQMQMSLQLTGNIACFLQLSLNILKRPREAANHLLGIPLQGIAQ